MERQRHAVTKTNANALPSWLKKRPRDWQQKPFLHGSEPRRVWREETWVRRTKTRFDEMAIAKNNAKQARKAALRLEAK